MNMMMIVIVVTMEMENGFRQFYLEDDKTHLHAITDSILKLQTMFGIIPNVKFKGEMGKVVYQMMLRARKESERNDTAQVMDPEIDTIVLLDRNIDLVSCMCTPLTYEGLFDELVRQEGDRLS